MTLRCCGLLTHKRETCIRVDIVNNSSKPITIRLGDWEPRARRLAKVMREKRPEYAASLTSIVRAALSRYIPEMEKQLGIKS